MSDEFQPKPIDLSSLIVDPYEKERNAFAQEFADYFLEESAGKAYVHIINFRLLLLANRNLFYTDKLRLELIYPWDIRRWTNQDTGEVSKKEMKYNIIATANVNEQKDVFSFETHLRPIALPSEQFPDLLADAMNTVIRKEFGDGFADWVKGKGKF